MLTVSRRRARVAPMNGYEAAAPLPLLGAWAAPAVRVGLPPIKPRAHRAWLA
jgi:hypothetical protein